MHGFVMGAVCLFAFAALWRRRHGWRRGFGSGHAGCGGGHAPCGGFFGHAPRRYGHFDDRFDEDGDEWGPRFGRRRSRGGFLRAVFERLDTTPGQEKAVAQAIDEVRDAGRRFRGEMKQSRGDVANAMRAEHFDAESLGLAFARHDEAIEAMRRALVGALAKVHDALDERQRARLAEMLESGGYGVRGFGGPYRGFA